VLHTNLNLAVKLTEDFLESTKEPGKGPYYAGSFDYGAGLGHGYTGDYQMGTSVANRTMNQRLMPAMMDHMLKSAPPGADVTSWRY